MPADRIAVIGGGLGGLAAACTLAGRGYRVVLFEESAQLGGLTTTLEAEGFRFDIGPALFTQPRTVDRIFREAGRKLPDYLDLVPLDPQWRCFFPDGTHLDLFADPQKMAQALDAFAPGSGAKYCRFMNHCHRLHEI